MIRSWTWKDEDNVAAEEESDEALLEAMTAQANELMARWNALERNHEAMAARRFDEEAGDYEAEMADEQAWAEAEDKGLEGEEASVYANRRQAEILASYDDDRAKAINRLVLQQQVIEDLLDALGARLARPYEHWNEDERLMQWLEEDRYDRYDDGR